MKAATRSDKSGRQTARRADVLRAVESHSADLTLRAAAVAAVLGATPRHVHLLLKQTGKSFTHHLLAIRPHLSRDQTRAIC